MRATCFSGTKFDKAKFDESLRSAAESLRGVAESVRTVAEEAVSMNDAPGWKIRCPKCGKSKDYAEAGGMRLGAPTSLGKKTLAYCTNCRKMCWAQIYNESSPPSSGDREQTWQELTAYVSEGSMSTDTAEAIASAQAPEHRKREIAAHVAEGVMTLDDALRMLRIS